MANAQATEVDKKQALVDYLSINRDVSAKDAVKAMKKQRIEVSESQVYNTRSMMKQGKLRATEAPPSPSVAPAVATATGKVTKVQAVQDYLAAHRNASRTEIVTALKAQGIDVSPTQVSGIKSKLKAMKGRKKAVASETAAAKPAAEDRISLSALLEAKTLAEKIGGVEKAKLAIAALAKLTE